MSKTRPTHKRASKATLTPDVEELINTPKSTLTPDIEELVNALTEDELSSFKDAYQLPQTSSRDAVARHVTIKARAERKRRKIRPTHEQVLKDPLAPMVEEILHALSEDELHLLRELYQSKTRQNTKHSDRSTDKGKLLNHLLSYAITQARASLIESGRIVPEPPTLSDNPDIRAVELELEQVKKESLELEHAIHIKIFGSPNKKLPD